MKKYRRVEINAFRRSVTIVSGEWRPGDVFDAPAAQTDDEVSLADSDVCEPVEPDSPEGQLILAEAVRSLKRRLSPEARADIYDDRATLTTNDPNRNVLFLKLRLFYGFIPRVFRFTHKEKSNAAKQSVED